VARWRAKERMGGLVDGRGWRVEEMSRGVGLGMLRLPTRQSLCTIRLGACQRNQRSQGAKCMNNKSNGLTPGPKCTARCEKGWRRPGASSRFIRCKPASPIRALEFLGSGAMENSPTLCSAAPYYSISLCSPMLYALVAVMSLYNHEYNSRGAA
jgi:hypothetical protein